MYPTISDLLQDLFGIHIALPIQTFGFMMAFSFLIAAWIMSLELKRKENLGLIKPFTKRIVVGSPATVMELFSSGLVGFIIGFKAGYIFNHYTEFVNDTQGVLLSSKGNLLFGIAIAAFSAWLRYREKEKEKLAEPKYEEITMHPYELVGNITMLAAIFGILGAKIFHNLENIDELMRDPLDALISFSGLTWYGGFIFATIAIVWYGRKHNIAAIHLSDSITPALMLAYGTGRIGCHLAGDGDWGIANLHPKPDWLRWMPDWAWAYNYPNNVINEGLPIPGCEGRHCHMLPDAVYPTPLYEAIVCILLFFFLWSIRKKLNVPGLMTSIYLLLTGMERFLIEKIRVNNKYHLGSFGITQAEIISFIMMIIGITGIIYLSRKKNQRIIQS